MNDFFKHRLDLHAKEMFRYLKYVFNDFFIIALMFFIGALGYAYANFLKGIVAGEWWQKVVIVFLLLLGVQIGNLATLIKLPDQVFLSPKEYSFNVYLKSAFRYSFSIAVIIQSIIIFIMAPFIVLSLQWSLTELIELLILVLVLKWLLLQNKLASLYLEFPQTNLINFIINWLAGLIIIGLSIYINPLIGILGSIICILGFQLKIKPVLKLINWKKLVNHENRRMSFIYLFFSLFQDVPQISAPNHHRRWLNPVLSLIKIKHEHTFTNLYFRTFVRNSEISSLFLRLLVIGFLAMIFTDNYVLQIFIYGLFVYLVGFQLLPFYKLFDDNVFIHIYPVSKQLQISNFRLVIQSLLLIEILLLAVGMLISGSTLISILACLVMGLFEIYCLTGPYLENKLKNEMEF